MAQQEITPFVDIKQILKQRAPSIARKLPDFIVNYLIRLVHQDEVNHLLSRYKDKEGVAFMLELIRYFDLTFDLINKEDIPTEGRYIFASNHPLGGLDGICLSALLGEHFHGNIRYFVNDLLLFIPNLRSIFIPINKHGKQAKNTAILTHQAYASDNQMITFPAGLCSRKTNGIIIDPIWKKSFIQKAVEYKRDVIPVCFEGENSAFFYRMANLRKACGIRMNYEMLYLPDELFKSKHAHYRISFGKPIPYQTFDQSKTPEQWAQWVREMAYKLRTNAH